MAENRIINEKKKASKGKSQVSLFTQLEQKLTFEWLFDPEKYSKYLTKFVWFIFLGIVYIYNSHVSERFSRDYDKLSKKVEDLRTHYTTLHADLMFESKESEVMKKVKEMGITDYTAPQKIIAE